MTNLSHTEISDYMTCRMRHALRHEFRLDPVGMVSESLDIGRAVHEALEAYFMGAGVEWGLDVWRRKAVEALPIEDPELYAKLDERREAASRIVERLIAALLESGLRLALDHNGEPLIERKFVVPFTGSQAVYYDGMTIKLDAMMLDQSGSLWVVDFKTRRELYSEDGENANLQNAIYCAGARVLGYPVIGSITVQVLSTPPSRPKQNANGDFSRQRIKTDWRTYAETVAAAGQDPAIYEAEMKPKLDVEFVRLTRTIRSERMLERVWNDIVEPLAVEIGEHRQGLRLPLYDSMFSLAKSRTVRNMSGRTCSGCPYPSPCLGSLRGLDAGPIIDHAFRYRETDRDGEPLRPRILALLGS